MADYQLVSQYPQASDLSEFLASQAGFAGAPSESQLTAYIGEAVEDWEAGTGYTPFLSSLSNAPTTRYYQPQRYRDRYRERRYVDLEMGWISITQVAVDVTPQNPTGAVLTQDLNYRLTPINAPADGKPFEAIEFLWQSGWKLPNSVMVTGITGWGVSIPQRVWNAILRRAAMLAISAESQPGFSLGADLHVGHVMIRDASISKFDKSKYAIWGREYAAALIKFKRVSGDSEPRET